MVEDMFGLIKLNLFSLYKKILKYGLKIDSKY